MTIEFKEEQITAREERTREPYIGYFAPNGSLINYNVLFGENYHDAWRNPVSLSFLSWVSYIIGGTSVEELKARTVYPDTVINIEYPGIDEYVKRGYGIDYMFEYDSFDFFLELLHKNIDEVEQRRRNYGGLRGYSEFEYELLQFFKNAYRDRKFFDSIQRKISIENPYVVQERLEHRYRNCNYLEDLYRDHLKKELMAYFKDICVQYLGYDSLERFKSNGTDIEIPNWDDEYAFDFLANPRIITSSYPNVNERYYNYLLMDWSVHRLPRYYYNEKTGIYEKSDFSIFYESETEQKLGKEIQSIKRLVPLKERKKYFR